MKVPLHVIISTVDPLFAFGCFHPSVFSYWVSWVLAARPLALVSGRPPCSSRYHSGGDAAWPDDWFPSLLPSGMFLTQSVIYRPMVGRGVERTVERGVSPPVFPRRVPFSRPVACAVPHTALHPPVCIGRQLDRPIPFQMWGVYKSHGSGLACAAAWSDCSASPIGPRNLRVSTMLTVAKGNREVHSLLEGHRSFSPLGCRICVAAEYV